VNCTCPEGVRVPPAAVTVAVITEEPPAGIVEALVLSVIVVLTTGIPDQTVTKL
jgi:hypothetical protein